MENLINNTIKYITVLKARALIYNSFISQNQAIYLFSFIKQP